MMFYSASKVVKMLSRLLTCNEIQVVKLLWGLFFHFYVRLSVGVCIFC